MVWLSSVRHVILLEEAPAPWGLLLLSEFLQIFVYSVNLYNEERYCIVVRLNSPPAIKQKGTVSLQSIVIQWPLQVSTPVTVEQRPHPLECDWRISCVSKATRRRNLYRWLISPPLLWQTWPQVPSTTWGCTPMSSSPSAVRLSSLRPKQVRPYLAWWNQVSCQVGNSGWKSVAYRVKSTVGQSRWVLMFASSNLHVFLK